MKDRVSTYPGRVTLTPVSGQTNTYDLQRADQPTEQGTPLNKANLLKDATALLYGLDDSAVPDDIFQWFGKYLWHRFEIEYDEFLLQGYSIFPSMQGTGNIRVSPNSSSSSYSPRTTVRYASACVYNSATGEFELSGTTTDLTITTTSNGTTLSGKYFKVLTVGYGCSNNFNTTDVYHYSGSAFSTSGSSPGYITASASGNTSTLSKVVPNVKIKHGTLTPVLSLSPTEYPNPSGLQGGYFYMYSGQLNQSQKHSARIITGTYIGTGTTSASSAVTVPCNQMPLFMVVSYNSPGGTADLTFAVIDLSGVVQHPLYQDLKPDTSTTQYNWAEYRTTGCGLKIGAYPNGVKAKYDEGQITFYVDSTSALLNASGELYNYFIVTV